MQMKTFDDIQVNDKVYYAIIDKDFNISSPKISWVANKKEEPFERCWEITLANNFKFDVYKGRFDAESFYGFVDVIIYSTSEENLKDAIEDLINRKINDYEYRLRNIQSDIKELRKTEKTLKNYISTLESKLS